jgi:3-hydroxyacyl-[acyl-carrier-protein] dehydratase
MRWMWIDRVVELERGKRLVAIKNVSLAEEHLHDHFAADEKAGLAALPVMPACFIIEGMAQTGGVLFGHANDFAFNVVLAKISKADFSREATPGCTLRYTAEIERMDAVGASVKGTVELLDYAKPGDGFVRIGSIELMFSNLDNNRGQAGVAGVDFPVGNFVFGESFKTLLRTSGF